MRPTGGNTGDPVARCLARRSGGTTGVAGSTATTKPRRLGWPGRRRQFWHPGGKSSAGGTSASGGTTTAGGSGGTGGISARAAPAAKVAAVRRQAERQRVARAPAVRRLRQPAGAGVLPPRSVAPQPQAARGPVAWVVAERTQAAWSQAAPCHQAGQGVPADRVALPSTSTAPPPSWLGGVGRGDFWQHRSDHVECPN